MGIWHLVVISADVDFAAVEQVATDLQAAHATGDIAYDALELGERLAPEVHDGLLGGHLETGQAGARVLLVRLADEPALMAYYESPAHAYIRRRFLSRVSPECERLYAATDARADNARVTFEQIEQLASGFMRRIDISMR